MPVSKWQLTLLVSMLSMIGPFSIDTYLPSFQSMEQSFEVSRALMTQTLGAYLMAFAVSTLIWGAITDWLGRKPVMLMTLGCYILASIACALSDNYEQFLIFRILQGLSIGGGLIAGRTMVRDLLETKEAQQVMAQAMVLFAAAPAIAPVIGGWLHEAFGWRSVFWFLAMYGMLVFLFTLFKAHESLAKEKRNSIHIHKVSSVYLSTLKNTHFLRLIFVYVAAFSSFFIYIAGAPTLLFDVLQLQADQFYVLFVPVVTGIMIAAFVSSKLIPHFTSQQMIFSFLIMMLAVALINLILTFTLEVSTLRVVVPLVFYSFSLAAIMPVLGVVIINCFPHNRGAASAMQAFIQMGFNGLTASIIVASLGASASNFAYVQLTLIMIALLLWLIDNYLKGI